ncbi:DUF1989 domain-containing protein [Bacillus mojavensis]|uniref:DUF1989 domain-containing protein n=1 Tax=Bacillus mojavensis TaxID=72360 RepID=UPI002DBB168D|nr:DUF1989 domain-containing protein [Bacillus mojavensis]MEC1635226.1 DUF1989 domain-containing protein [Bacillus mojavensis]
MTKQYIVQPKKGLGLKLKKGQILKVVDVEGQQVADFVAYHAKDFYEHLDQGATIDANHSIHVKVNDHIYSNLYKPMLTLIEDTVGKHDLLLPACRPDMNRLLYGKQKDEFQDTCYDNMNRALEQFGVPKPHMHYPFAIFMNTVLDEKGNLSVETPLSNAGDYVRLRAEMDLVVAFSSCPIEKGKCNGDSVTSIRVEVS